MKRVTGKMIENLVALSGLHVRRTGANFIVSPNYSSKDWVEHFQAPREVAAFLRGYIRGRESRADG